MKHVVVAAFLFTSACGTILNADTKTAILPPGATINGQGGAVVLDQSRSYQVRLADGSYCAISSNISIGWAVADVFFTALLGVVVDAATGGWKSLDGSACPGVALD